MLYRSFFPRDILAQFERMQRELERGLTQARARPGFPGLVRFIGRAGNSLART